MPLTFYEADYSLKAYQYNFFQFVTSSDLMCSERRSGNLRSQYHSQKTVFDDGVSHSTSATKGNSQINSDDFDQADYLGWVFARNGPYCLEPPQQ